MRRIDPTRLYPEDYYDHQMCLKPPLLLWAAMIYLSRAIALPFAMGIATLAHVDSRAIDLLRSPSSAAALVSSLLAVLVIFSLVRRLPKASKPVRWIWAHGRMFLAASALLDIVWLVIPVLRQGSLDDESLLAVGAAVLDAFFLAYIMAARIVRDVFSDFPLR